MHKTDYTLIAAQAHALTDDESDALANLSNLAALLYQSMDAVNWAGFYLLRGDELVLGPFQGQSACVRIPLGSGVCGTAAAENRICRIADVHQFPGHIACDAASESEIVLPLRHNGSVIGVLDIDSPQLDRFSPEDEVGLQTIATLAESCIARSPKSLGLGAI